MTNTPVNDTKSSIPCWHNYFFNLIDVIKTRSPDPRTKHGCIAVGSENQILSTGYNALPFGIKTVDEKLTPERKIHFIEHAERNCIYLASRSGTSLKDAKLYVSGISCCDCARAIIQSGIKEVIIDHENQEKWAASGTRLAEHFQTVIDMFDEAGITFKSWIRSESRMTK